MLIRCSDCDTPHDIDDSVLNQTGITTFKCSRCDKKNHIQIEGSVPITEIPCPNCHVSFVIDARKIIRKNIRFTCSSCSHKFSQTMDLEAIKQIIAVFNSKTNPRGSTAQEVEKEMDDFNSASYNAADQDQDIKQSTPATKSEKIDQSTAQKEHDDIDKGYKTQLPTEPQHAPQEKKSSIDETALKQTKTDTHKEQALNRKQETAHQTHHTNLDTSQHPDHTAQDDLKSFTSKNEEKQAAFSLPKENRLQNNQADQEQSSKQEEMSTVDLYFKLTEVKNLDQRYYEKKKTGVPKKAKDNFFLEVKEYGIEDISSDIRQKKENNQKIEQTTINDLEQKLDKLAPENDPPIKKEAKKMHYFDEFEEQNTLKGVAEDANFIEHPKKKYLFFIIAAIIVTLVIVGTFLLI